MGVYCYADGIGLLSPSLSGLKEMLKLCEDYALKHKIIFIRRVWKIPYRTHNKLVHLINKSCSINTVFEKKMD